MRVSTWQLVAVVCLLLAGPAVADGASAPPGAPERAALAVLRGDPERARALLAKHQSDPGALVVLASLALDEGKLREAKTLVTRLHTLRPEAAEPRLLAALLRQRRDHSRSDWLSAGLAALKTVHPVPESPPLLDVWDHVQTHLLSGESIALPEDTLRKLDIADAFLVRWAWPRPPGAAREDVFEEAIRLAGSDERLVVHLAALDALRPPYPASKAAVASAAQATLLARLRLREPGAALIIALEAHADTEPLSEGEVRAIDAAVPANAPALFAVQYGDLLRVLEKVDPAQAPGLAMGRAVTLVIERYYPGPLRHRLALKPPLSDAARERLARALVRLADATEREGLLLTDMLASVTLGVAHGLTGDEALKSRAESLRDEGQAMQDASRCLKPLMRLPIRSLQRAWAEQVPHERTLLRQMHGQGLACPESPLRPREPPGEVDGHGKQGGCPDGTPK